jgi:hypothetical protein
MVVVDVVTLAVQVAVRVMPRLLLQARHVRDIAVEDHLPLHTVTVGEVVLEDQEPLEHMIWGEQAVVR